MSAEIGAGDAATGRYDTLHAEAKEALAYAANTLRGVTERYREAFHEDLGGWHADGDVLDLVDRRTLTAAEAATPGANGTAGHGAGSDAPTVEATAAAVEAAEEAAEDGRASELRRRIALRAAELGERQTELARLELAVRGLERTWLFLERGDASLLADPAAPDLADDLQMRIVEAREAERTRLSQEIHDGPAQALANAIFGVEYIEKILDRDRAAARTELRSLRERLRRDLADVRAFISQLRPPILDEVGLDGAIHDAADTLSALTGVAIELDLAAPVSALGDAEQVVVLRVLQEALQNVRKHAGARRVWIATRLDEGHWILEARDDGRGFDPETVSVPGRRTFGLQFMRERAELVRGTCEIRSRPADGTVVVLDIPVDERGGSG
jgi:signal transduction histidine kinase